MNCLVYNLIHSFSIFQDSFVQAPHKEGYIKTCNWNMMLFPQWLINFKQGCELRK